MKRCYLSLLLGLGLFFDSRLHAVKTVGQLHDDVCKITSRYLPSVAISESAVRRLSTLSQELDLITPDCCDDAVKKNALSVFVENIFYFNKVCAGFRPDLDRADLAQVADDAIILKESFEQMRPSGFDVKFIGYHAILDGAVSVLLKKIRTAQLFLAINDRADVDAQKFIDLGADVNGSNQKGQSPLDCAYLLPTIPEEQDPADEYGCDEAAAAKLRTQGVLIDAEADLRTVNVDDLIAQQEREREAKKIEQLAIEQQSAPVLEVPADKAVLSATTEPLVVALGAGQMILKKDDRVQGPAVSKKIKKKKKVKREQVMKTPAAGRAVKPSPSSRRAELMQQIIELVTAGNVSKLGKVLKSLRGTRDEYLINDITVVGDKGSGALLCYAVDLDNGTFEEIMKYSKKLKINPNAFNSKNISALDIAMSRGRIFQTRALLEAGVSIGSSLHLFLGHVVTGRITDCSVLFELLNYCPKDIIDSDLAGLYPLHVATEIKDPLVIDKMIKIGADINIQSKTKRNPGATPLLYAIYHHNYDAAKALLGAGADATITDHTGTAALHAAIDRSDDRMIELLLDYPDQIDVNQKTRDGLTPLQLLCGIQYKKCNFALAKRLIDMGVDVNASVTLLGGEIEQKTETTLLNIACSIADLDLVRFLCEHGYSVNALDRGGNHALDILESLKRESEKPEEDQCDSVRDLLASKPQGIFDQIIECLKGHGAQQPPK